METEPAEGHPAADRKKALLDFVDALPRGELLFVNSGHFVQHDAAPVVVREIQRLLDDVRNRSPR
jgi:hypothetical protein